MQWMTMVLVTMVCITWSVPSARADQPSQTDTTALSPTPTAAPSSRMSAPLLDLDAEAHRHLQIKEEQAKTQATHHRQRGPFWKSWWFWTSIGVAGAAAAAGTGAWYYVNHRDPEPHSVDVTATWQPAGHH